MVTLVRQRLAVEMEKLLFLCLRIVSWGWQVIREFILFRKPYAEKQKVVGKLMGFEILTGTKVTIRGTCSDRTDYFGLRLKRSEKVRIKLTQVKEIKLFYT